MRMMLVSVDDDDDARSMASSALTKTEYEEL